MSNIIKNIQALINDFKVKVLLPEEKGSCFGCNGNKCKRCKK